MQISLPTITVSGEVGSGKSTVAKILSKKLDRRLLSTGAIQREMAAKRGMDSLDFNLYSETHPELDSEIDAYTISLSSSPDPLIIDSRMAWHFLPDAFKVFLIIDPVIAGQRILSDSSRKETESYEDLERTVENARRRMESEQKRFMQVYNVDYSDFDNYDLVVDSSFADVNEVACLVERQLSKQSQRWAVWVAPKRLYPTQHVRELQGLSDYPLPDINFECLEPIKVIYFRNRFFILDGHKRTSVSIMRGLNLIPVEVILREGAEVVRGLDVSIFIADHCTRSWLYDWEDCHGFRFLEYPE